MPKRNATEAHLKWKKDRLWCNGVCVANIYKVINWWAEYALGEGTAHRTRSAARRAINKRFGLPPSFGSK